MLFDELHRPVRRQAVAVRHIELHKTASLAAGLSEHDDFTVPAGLSWLGRRIRCFALAPPTAASGFHLAQVELVGQFTSQTAGTSAGHAASLIFEADIIGFVLASGRHLRLFYGNQSNVAQTNPRNWHVTVIEEAS